MAFQAVAWRIRFLRKKASLGEGRQPAVSRIVTNPDTYHEKEPCFPSRSSSPANSRSIRSLHHWHLPRLCRLCCESVYRHNYTGLRSCDLGRHTRRRFRRQRNGVCRRCHLRYICADTERNENRLAREKGTR